MQCRLIYRSLATEDVVANEVLRELEETSSANNRKAGITGLLLYTGHEFLQVLEGPEKEVNALFQKISRDPRHETVRLLTFELIGPVYFEQWSMRVVDLFDLPGPERQLFMAKYQHEDGVVGIPESLHEIYALLLDARAVGQGAAPEPKDSAAGRDES